MGPFSWKAIFASILLLQQAVAPPVASHDHFRYERPVTVLNGPAGVACAAIDAEVFAHAQASLKDLRLYRNGAEVPYAVTLSEPVQQESEEARILNLGLRAGLIVFDLEMPHRPYTMVTLDLAAKDFIATAEVSGGASPGATALTKLGSFTLFDLTAQRLSRNTSVSFSESSFPFLHIELAMTPAPGSAMNPHSVRNSVGTHDPAIVKTATIPPSREAQTVYTTIAQTATLLQQGRQSVATFQVPVRVPVERIAFEVAAKFKGNFSREVHVKAHAVPGSKADAVAGDDATPEDASRPNEETLTGTISRVHATEAGRELTEEQLSLPAAVGSNMQRPATLEVDLDNGDDAPLPIDAVKLEMRQRRICFDAPEDGAPLTLDYGDARLDAPVYDYAKLFQPVAVPRMASLGAEMRNAAYQAAEDGRPFTERHPELLWVGLLAVVCILAVTAIRSAKRLH